MFFKVLCSIEMLMKIGIYQLPVSAARWQHWSHMFGVFNSVKNHKIDKESPTALYGGEISADLESQTFLIF